jgi:hypothetical protein
MPEVRFSELRAVNHDVPPHPVSLLQQSEVPVLSHFYFMSENIKATMTGILREPCLLSLET